MACARVRLSRDMDELLSDEMERAIDQAALGRYDTIIAKRYLLDKIPQIEIAAEIDCERSTVSKRIPHILRRVEAAAKKMRIIP